jgi:hypothetical protein
MVSRRPLGLEARPSDSNAALPTRVPNLRRGVSINRLLPVCPLGLIPLRVAEGHISPLEFSRVAFPTTQLPITQSPAQHTMGTKMGTTTRGSMYVMHPPSSRAWLVERSSSSSHHWGRSHGSACSRCHDYRSTRFVGNSPVSYQRY